jgi:hypothetical protein
MGLGVVPKPCFARPHDLPGTGRPSRRRQVPVPRSALAELPTDSTSSFSLMVTPSRTVRRPISSGWVSLLSYSAQARTTRVPR